MSKANDNLVILAGQEIDVDLLTKTYTDIPDEVEVIVGLTTGTAAKLTFRTFPRKSELDQIISDARQFFKGLAKGCPSKNHPWADRWPQSLQEYLDAKLLSELSVAPKLSIETTLVWQRNASFVRDIMTQIEVASKTVPTHWLTVLMDEKKSEDNQTGSTEP